MRRIVAHGTPDDRPMFHGRHARMPPAPWSGCRTPPCTSRPKDEIPVSRFGPRCETRNQNAGGPARMEAVVNGPGSRTPPLGKRARPAAGHLLQRYPVFRSPPLRREISDVSAIDVVGAKNARIDTMSEALIGLLDRCHDAECKVKRLHTLRIEARALYCRAIAGCRFESPARVMRAIAGSLEPQAKPPRAM